MTPEPWSRRMVLMVGVALFVVAAVVRVAMLHTARFGGDEALFFRIGMDIVEGKSFPLLGTQITDGAARLPGPAFLYLMALPLVVSRTPEAQYLWVELLGALTVVILWLSMRRPFGERAAALTGLWIACSPWSALYADRTWNPNVLPLLVAVALWCAWRLRDNPGSRAAIVLWPTLFAMAQFHMSAPVAWVGVVVVVGWRALREGDRRRHAIGFALAALLYVPMLIHEFQTGFGNLRHLLAETIGRVGGERHPLGFLWVPVYAVRLLSLDVTYHELTGYWGGPDEWKCLHALIDGTVPRPAHPLRAFALGASVVVAIGAWWRTGVSALVDEDDQRRTVARVALAASLLAVASNMLLMGVAAKQVFGHYVTNLFSFEVLLLATALSWALARPLGSRVRHVATALVVVTCLGGIEATWSVSQRVDARIGLGVHRRAAQVIRDDADQAGLPQSAPIRLDFIGLRSSLYDWHIFGTRALGLPWHFDARARARRYALTPPDAQRPRGADGDPIDVGAAWLWRLR